MHHFLKLTTALLACLICVPALGADVCKGFKVKEDPFSGGSTMNVNVQILTQFTAIAIDLKLEGDTAEYILTVKEGGAYDSDQPAGMEVPFLFEDGEVLQFVTCRPVTTKAWTDGSGVYTNVTYAFTLDRETLERMSEHAITSIRIPTSKGNYDWNASKPIQKKTKKVAACMASMLSS